MQKCNKSQIFKKKVGMRPAVEKSVTNLGFATGGTPASPELGCGIINALTPYIR